MGAGHPTVTICTVSFGHREHLQLNQALAAALNPDAEIRWIVVENTPGAAAGDLQAALPGALVLAGTPPPEEGVRTASDHHAAALARALERGSGGGPVLVLDPDFFLIRPGWVAHFAAAVREGPPILGAPWHPHWYTKFRYFPSPHCFLADTSRLPLARLDFRPGPGRTWAEEPLPPAERATRDRLQARLERWARRLPTAGIGAEVACNLRFRHRIGASQETGYFLYRDLALGAAMPAECFQPVYRPARHYAPPGARRVSRLLDRLLPECASYAPRRRGYSSARDFQRQGLPSAMACGWEEFNWRGRAVGFHVRGFNKADRSGEVAALRRVLRGSLQALGVPPPGLMED